jgi:hypothetical protein
MQLATICPKPNKDNWMAWRTVRKLTDVNLTTYNIHEKTLRVWALWYVRFQGTIGKRLYHIGHSRKLLGDKTE